MSEVRVEFDGVWKKFRRGSWARSLRDAIPAATRRLLGRKSSEDGSLSDGEFYSLKDLSFQVKAGECLGIVGSNGAGKSTILKCTSRILRPNRGEVRVNGRVCALIEVGAGFHPDLTGRENVYLMGTILGMRRQHVSDRFDAIVDFSGLADFIDTPVKRYSSGMFARLGFSVAAFMDPDVLLIDEVLSVGDVGFARKCEQKIQEITSSDTAVIFISHNLAAVRAICNRSLLLHQGSIKYDGTPAEAIRRYHEMLHDGNNIGQSHDSITSVRMQLLDPRRKPTHHAIPGAEMLLELEITARDHIEDANIGFFVRDEHNQEVYACSREILGKGTRRIKAGETVHTTFRFLNNLVPGTYWVGSFIEGKPAGVKTIDRLVLDRTQNRLQLPVIGPEGIMGSANLFADCLEYRSAKYDDLRVPKRIKPVVELKTLKSADHTPAA